MRLVQVVVPDEKREQFFSTLRDREMGVSAMKEISGDTERTLISFIVPADAVEHILNDLQEIGLEEAWYMVSVETEFATFEGVDAVQDRWAKTPNKVAPRTLRSKAKDMRLNTRSYLWMMVLSAVVAVSGILVASPAVVVGSMIIAPIVSPTLAVSIGLTIGASTIDPTTTAGEPMSSPAVAIIVERVIIHRYDRVFWRMSFAFERSVRGATRLGVFAH